ncbi:hypothetical protein GCM10025881_08770 [Pseudolysinimonas kribbensis]|uniref:FHA domain-containing protein n=1 Tax=Pseudolysinimonas kribbensis TaxID=433641 RepID=A0ABQ6K3C4_9MICO|nr:FHA domain-containing protein [Pseudolysinimonas kribbensis]GMA94053.1 hypothetical protein GCM10025881_08770 [Pseudolysinimonas kribbensis]
MLAVGDPAQIGDLTARLAGPDGFRAALERLVSGGIAAAPDFALIDAAGGIARIVLRGAAEVDAGAERLSGAGVTTWTERVLEGVDELRLRVPGSSWTLLPGGPAVSGVVGRAAERFDEADAHTTLVPAREERAASPATAPVAPIAAVAAPAAAAAGAPAVEDEPYAFLFGDTVYRTISGDSVRIPNPDPARPGDHDGRTVLVDELEEHEPAEPPAVAAASGPVLALELPGGDVEPLTRPVLVGRSPSDPGHDASGGPPRLVVVAAGDKDISRTHARIEVAGGAVVVTDLDSKNGTSVTMPGAAPRRLRAGEPAVVLPDTVIDLGGGVMMTVRETA